MTNLATLAILLMKSLLDLSVICDEFRELLDRAERVRCSQSESALVKTANSSMLLLHQDLHRGFLPAGCPCWMFMTVKATIVVLQAAQQHSELEEGVRNLHLGILFCGDHFLKFHMRFKLLNIPHGAHVISTFGLS